MPEELVRDHLPIPDRPYAGHLFEDAKDRTRRFHRSSLCERLPELPM